MRKASKVANVTKKENSGSGGRSREQKGKQKINKILISNSRFIFIQFNGMKTKTAPTNSIKFILSLPAFPRFSASDSAYKYAFLRE